MLRHKRKQPLVGIALSAGTPQLQTLIREFSDYLIHTGYGKSSCSMLPDCIRDFLGHAAEPIIKNLSQRHIQAFYEYLQQRPHKKKEGGLSDQYIHHHVYALRLFFNWLESTGWIKYNPMSVMKFKAPEGNPRQPLTDVEIRILFEASRTSRETAMLHLFYSCGLRRSEGEALNISDVHFKKQLLYVRAGKGSKRRVVPMSVRVSMELEAYYHEDRRLSLGQESEAFMLNGRGVRMRGRGYNRLLKTVLSRTSLNPSISLHHLRHSIATHLLASGLELESVRDFLGHACLESTQIYTKVPQHLLKKTIEASL